MAKPMKDFPDFCDESVIDLSFNHVKEETGSVVFVRSFAINFGLITSSVSFLETVSAGIPPTPDRKSVV